jgi:hypothetical protein
MNKTIPHTITVTVADSSCDNKIEISLNKYSDIDDWIKVFKTILIHQTFTEDTVKELFEYPWDEYDKAMEDKKEIEYSSSFNQPPPVAWWNEPIGKPVNKEAW